jgi:hypothetical protein
MLGRLPLDVDAGQSLDGSGILAADQHAVGLHEIGDGGAFAEELGIGEHREAGADAIAGLDMGGGEDRLHGFGGAHQQRALFHHHGVPGGMGGHGASAGFDPAQVACLAGTEATAFGGGVHGDEHHVCRGDGRLHGGGEVEVAAPAAAHHFGQAGFVDGQLAGIGIIPGGDALGVEIHHRHLDLGAAIGDHRHGGAAHVARAVAAGFSRSELQQMVRTGELMR